MKSAIKNILFFVVLFLVFDFIFYKSRHSFGGWRFYHFFEVLAYFTLFFLFLLSMLYKKAFTFKSSKVKVVVILVLCFVLSYHLAGRVIAINNGYYTTKMATWDVSPGLWKFDKELAYVGVPNATGTYSYYIGDSITVKVPVYFDANGYRTVPESLQLRAPEKDLFLGCSWTFGDLVNAENTYPYLIAKGLGHSYTNTGASGYGEAQMMEIANKLIPKNHYTYTFIQLSPWLADRSMDICGPTGFGYWPNPYFSKNKDGKFELHPLAYSILGTYEHEWRNAKMSYWDKFRFCLRLGTSIEIADYYSYNFAKLLVATGVKAKPTKDKKDLEVYFYNYLVDLCKANNTTPVIIKFGYNYPTDSNMGYVERSLAGKVRIIDLDSATHELAKGASEEQYSKLFKIWHVTKRGDSIFANGHPSVYAHKVFADKVISVLKTQ